MELILEPLKMIWTMLTFMGRYFVWWAPFILAPMLWEMFREYKRAVYISKIEWVILEVRLPKEIRRTPLAMEIFLNTLYQTSKGTWYDQWFKGRVRDWFALELVSFGGDVRFFVRTPRVYKNLIESQIYAQYQKVEVHEVPDYVQLIDYKDENSSDWSIWGTEYQLDKPDAYPIRTYVDYGMDKPGIKEEDVIDPFASVVEFFGSIRKDEQLWFQILVQATEKRFYGPADKWGRRSLRDWKDEGRDLIKKINEKYRPKPGEVLGLGELTMTLEDKEAIKAIERSVAKLGFDVGIRGVYLSRGKFDTGRIKGLLGVFRAFDSNVLNKFKPKNPVGFDYPWQDYKKIRENSQKSTIFNAYKRRSYFYSPYKRKPFVLNAEELATVYHFPGLAAGAPTLGHIESTKGEPPTNLPL